MKILFMKKIVFFLLFLCAFVFSNEGSVHVNVDWAFIREKPNVESRRLARLPLGSYCNILERKNGWLHVANCKVHGSSRRNDYKGWLSSSLTSFVSKPFDSFSVWSGESVLSSKEKIDSAVYLDFLKKCAVVYDTCRTKLFQYYKGQNDEKGLSHWRRLYDKLSFRPIYIAIFDKKKLQVFGAIDSSKKTQMYSNRFPLHDHWSNIGIDVLKKQG